MSHDILISALVGLWLYCAAWSYGLTVGYFVGEYPMFPHVATRVFAATVAVLIGPAALVGTLSFLLKNTFRHGWRI